MRIKVKHMKRWVGFFAIVAFMTTLAFSAKDQMSEKEVKVAADSINAKAAKDAPSYGLLSAVSFDSVAPNYLGGIALDKQGKVWSWGWNQHGQLGVNKGYGINSSATNQLGYAGGVIRIPYFVDKDITIVEIAAGYHYCLALDDQGNVYGWGHNNTGQIGQTTNTTFPSGVGIIEPTKINGFSNKKIVKISANNGYLDSNVGMALDEEGGFWVWGDNGAGEHGQGIRTNTIAYQTTPHQVTFSENISIAGFTAGGWTGAYGSYIQLWDTNGDIWSWGYKGNGVLGDGTTAEAATNRQLVPTKMSKPVGMGKIIDVSSSYRSSVALDESGNAWRWGMLFLGGTSGTAAGGTNRTVYPEKVEINTTEVANIGYTPVFKSVSAGESVSYALDQFGRSWAWGDGRYYGFGAEGPWEELNNQIENKAVQYPKIFGDGMTSTYGTQPKFPVYKADAAGKLADSYLGYGDGGVGYDESYPTIYDEKYMAKDSAGYVLDEAGTRLVYQTTTTGGRTRGYYYKLDINNNPTTEKGIPAIDESEKVWIGLAFQEVAKINKIYGSRSSSMIIDEDGNLFRWGNDGSGSIAWGWDVDKYDRVGNDKDGLYDKYTPEVMFMRGSPNIETIMLNISKPTKKIYKSTGQTDTAKVTATLPAEYVSEKQNFNLKAELQDVKYVKIPYNPADPNFGITEPTKEQFEAAYGNAAYTNGDLLDETISSGAAAQSVDFNIEVTDNCQIWVMIKDVAYTRTTYTVKAYTADNFYTDTTLQHKGEKYGDSNEEIYAPTSDNVAKQTTLPEAVDPKAVYGLPLDINGAVIANPTFGYDKVKITRYDPADPANIEIYKYWNWHTPQDPSVDIELNDLKYMTNPANTHIFYYDINPAGWVTVNYKGIEKATGAEIPDFTMASEIVKIDKPLTRKPPEINSYTLIGYQVNGSSLTNLVNGEATFTPTGPTEVVFVYQLPIVHLRQVILNPSSSVALPTNGYLSLLNVKQSDWTTIDSANNIITNSGLDSNSVEFMKYEVTVKADATGYLVKWVTPQYYEYAGHIASITNGNHNAADRVQTGEIKLDFDAASEYWVTLYLKPSKDNPASYSWGDRINNFGKIETN